MERRDEPRFIENLPVRVWVIDERGRRLTQLAVAHNISRGGALLMGLEHQLRCGDLVVVEYRTVKARFRIVWIRDSEGPYKIKAAVQRLEEDRCPWEPVILERELLHLP
ncbi:MAG: PilZ domain-containing protein [Terriglobales bacterium]